MIKYEITKNDIDSNFFHFTLESNLHNIEKNGLLPKKGKTAKYIEDTPKVFFVKGLDNLLILFDCWINVYLNIPILPDSKLTYGLCTKAMSSKYFPMFLVDLYFLLFKNSKRHKKNAFKVFAELLNNNVLLNLDIQENIDYKLTDIDEIKSKGFRKRHLIRLGYSEKYSDMDSNKMDDWNLHTITNKVIEANKIKLCYLGDSYKIKDIFEYAIKNTNLDLKDICPNLYEYLNSK